MGLESLKSISIKLLQFILKWTLRLCLAGFVIVALYLSLMRYYLPKLNDYRQDIETTVSYILNQDFSISNLEGQLRGLSPSFSADNITIKSRQDGSEIINVNHVSLRPSIRQSIFNFGPYLKSLSSNNISIRLHERNGSWSLFGGDNKVEVNIEKLQDIFQALQSLKIDKLKVQFVYSNNETIETPSIDVDLQRDNQFRRIAIHLLSMPADQDIKNNKADDFKGDFLFEGDGELFAESLKAQWTLKTQQLDLHALSALFVKQKTQLNFSAMDIDLHGDINPQQQSIVQGSVNIGGVEFIRDDKTSQINQLATSLRWKKASTKIFNEQTLWLEDLHFNQAGIEKNISDKVKIDWRSNDSVRQLKAAATKINAQATSQLLTTLNILPEKSNTMVANLSIKGDLIKPQFYLQQLKEDLTYGAVLNSALKNTLEAGSSETTTHQSLHNQNLTADSKAESIAETKEQTKVEKATANNIALIENSKSSVKFSAPQWQFSSQLNDVSCEADSGIPGIQNLDADLWANNKGGVVTVKNLPNLKAYFEDVYDKPLHFDDISGAIFWDIYSFGAQVYSNPLNAQYDGGEVSGWFGVGIDFDKEQPTQLTLNLGVKNVPALAHQELVPIVIPKSTRSWLNESIVSGYLEQGALLLHGAVGSRKKHQSMDEIAAPTLQLSFDVSNASLKYQPNWPALSSANGNLWLDQRNLEANISSAKTLSSKVEKASATLRPVKPGKDLGMKLQVKALIDGDAQDVIKAVSDSKVSPVLSDTMKNWTLNGNAKSKLDLALTLGAKNVNPQVKVESTLNKVAFKLGDQDLEFANLNGTLNYDLSRGLSTKDAIRASLFGYPVTAKVSNNKKCFDSTSKHCTHIALDGKIDAGTLLDFTQQQLLKNLEGTTKYRALVEIPESQGVNIFVTSDGQGISSSLPEPFRKLADEKIAINFKQKVSAKHSDMRLRLKDKLLLKIKKYENGNQELLIALGDASNKRQQFVKNKIQIVGDLDVVDIKQWQPLISDLLQSKNTNKQVNSIENHSASVVADQMNMSLDANYQVDNLHIKRMRYEQRYVDDLVVNMQGIPKGFEIDVKSDVVDGIAKYYLDQRPVDLSLDHIDIGAIKTNSVAAVKTPTISTLNISAIPDINFHADKISSGDIEFGQWSFKLRKDPDNDQMIVAKNIIGSFGSIKVNSANEQGALYTWSVDQGSSFNGRFTSKNIEDELKRLKYNSVIKAKDARLDMNVFWQGSILDFSLLQSQGQWEFELNDGYLLKAPSTATGVLKIISVANLTSILSDLRLSIADLAEEGLRFNELKGKVNSGAAVFETATPLTIKGASSEIKVDGFANAKNGQIGAKLVVTIPLGSNLPWIVALAGGLPAAAGVFVVSKLFKETVDELSSLVYKISGTISEPKVNFSSLFNFGGTKNADEDSKIKKQMEDNMNSADSEDLKLTSDAAILDDAAALDGDTSGLIQVPGAVQSSTINTGSDVSIGSPALDDKNYRFICNYFICI